MNCTALHCTASVCLHVVNVKSDRTIIMYTSPEACTQTNGRDETLLCVALHAIPETQNAAGPSVSHRDRALLLLNHIPATRLICCTGAVSTLNAIHSTCRHTHTACSFLHAPCRCRLFYPSFAARPFWPLRIRNVLVGLGGPNNNILYLHVDLRITSSLLYTFFKAANPIRLLLNSCCLLLVSCSPLDHTTPSVSAPSRSHPLPPCPCPRHP